MDNFVILAALPTGWPTPQQGGDGGGRATTGMTSRSPVKVLEEIIDSQGGKLDTIVFVPLGGKVRALCIASLPNHEAALKVTFALGQQGFQAEYGVAIDPAAVTHAWESVQQQTASTRGR